MTGIRNFHFGSNSKLHEIGQTYEQLVISQGPYAYYRLDETSGTTIADASGNSRDGTLNGSNAVLGEPGAVQDGTAIHFNPQLNNTDYVDTGEHLKPLASSLATGVTVTCWIKFDRTSTLHFFGTISDGATLIFHGAVNRDENASNAPGRLFARYRDDDDNIRTSTTARSDLNDDAWHHVAMVFDPSQNSEFPSIFVDGSDNTGATSDNNTGGIMDNFSNAQYPVYFGDINSRGSTTQAAFSGLLDEVAFFDKALTPSEIQAQYDAG